MSDNAELINSAYSSFARGDVAGIIGVLSERVEWDVTAVLPQAGSWRGRDGAGEFFDQLASQWADLTLDVEQMVSEGDHVVAIGRAAGRLREHGDAAAGYHFVHVFTVADGAVTRFREWADPDEELREHIL
jgi:ketosteroid isomerase-like protein